MSTAKKTNAKQLFIICPAYLRDNWKDEVNLWYPDAEVGIQSYASKSIIPKSDFLIIDEGHYAKNIQAQRSKKIHKFLRQSNPEYFIGLTGTPMKRDASDFFSYLKMLKVKHRLLEFPDNFYQFQKRYCRAIPNDFTPSGYSYEGVNPDNVAELKKLIRPYFLFNNDESDLPPTEDRKYLTKKRSKNDALLEEAWEQGRSQEFMALKALNAEVNVATTNKLLTDLMYENKRPVVFSEHRASSKMIADKFGVKAILGGMSDEERTRILNRFKEGLDPVLVGTFGAMGSGLNITCSDTMVFNDYSHSATDYDQARKRIHRIGQEKHCFYHHVFTSEMDYKIFRKMVGKRKDAKTVYGG